MEPRVPGPVESVVSCLVLTSLVNWFTKVQVWGSTAFAGLLMGLGLVIALEAIGRMVRRRRPTV